MNRTAQHTHPIRPLFNADWDSVVMIHLEVEPMALQKVTPFPIVTSATHHG